jgi:hypothetical protein
MNHHQIFQPGTTHLFSIVFTYHGHEYPYLCHETNNGVDMMTEFQKAILEGIPDTMPEPRPWIQVLIMLPGGKIF